MFFEGFIFVSASSRLCWAALVGRLLFTAGSGEADVFQFWRGIHSFSAVA